MSIFGWSYPAGAANDPNAPWNQQEQPCDVCGNFEGNFENDCICPECSVCGSVGDPLCYDAHGLIRTQEQIDSMEKAEAEWKAAAEAENEEITAWLSQGDF